MAPAADIVEYRGEEKKKKRNRKKKNKEKEKGLFLRVRNDRRGFDWYRVDLEKRPDKILKKMNWPMDPESGKEGILFDGVLALGPKIYVLGGVYVRPIHYSDDVRCLDTRCPEDGWKAQRPLLSPWKNIGHNPSVAIDGKIYVISYILQEFDPHINQWLCLTPLPDGVLHASRPLPDGFMHASPPLLPDFANDRFLVHFNRLNSLYAYSLKDKNWSCLSKDFGPWYLRSVVVDGVLYSHPDASNSLLAYDLVNNEWLATEWSTPFHERLEIRYMEWDVLLYLGNGALCLAYSHPSFGHKSDVGVKTTIIHCSKFKFKKTPDKKVLFDAVCHREFCIKDGGMVKDFLTVEVP